MGVFIFKHPTESITPLPCFRCVLLGSDGPGGGEIPRTTQTRVMVRTIERIECDFDVQYCFTVYDVRSDGRSIRRRRLGGLPPEATSNFYLND